MAIAQDLVVGPFVVDHANQCLRRESGSVQLSGRAFAVLSYLLAHRGRLVTKAEMLDALWPETYVGEAVLKTYVNELRRAFDDDVRTPRFIETLRGRGYRFIADVREAQAAAGPELLRQEGPAAAGAKRLFVGRREELARARACVARMLDGEAGVLMLVGEPGIGKTALSAEIADHARSREIEVLTGHCYEGEGAPAFWPWVQILRRCVAQGDGALYQPDQGAADLALLLPELREQFPQLTPAAELEPEQARFRLFDSLATFFKNASRTRPLLLIMDDLHWADRPSLLLLRFLAQGLGVSRVLILGTYRNVEIHPDHPLHDIFTDLHGRAYERLALHGLPDEDARVLLTSLAGGTLPEHVVVEILRKTEGNPYFIRELLNDLVAGGGLPAENAAIPPVDGWVSSLQIPEGVARVIERRLSRLSPACRSLLMVAALIGREFDLTVLMQAWRAHTGGDDAAGTVLDLADEAEETEILETVRDAVAPTWRFSHAFLREVLMQAPGRRERARLHGIVAETLEGLHASNLGPHLAEIARHYFRAAPAGAGAKAVHFGAEAARRAMGSLAYEEAVGYLELALQALALDANASDLRRCELLTLLAEALRAATDTARAREVFLHVAALAKKLIHAGNDAARPFLVRAALGMGTEHEPVGRVDASLVQLLEDALTALGEEQGSMRAMVLARLAFALYDTPESIARRRQLDREAQALARRLEDPRTLAHVLVYSRWAGWGPDDLQERLAKSAELAVLAGRLGVLEWRIAAHGFRITDLLEAGDIIGSDAEMLERERHSAALGQPWFAWTGLRFQVTRALLDGRFDDAERLANEALTTAQQRGYANALQLYGAQIAILRMEQGRFGEIEPALRGFMAQNPGIRGWRCGLAYLYAVEGREAEARAEVDALATHAFADLPRDNIWLVAMAFLAETCARVNDAERARLLYDLLVPHAAQCAVLGYGYGCLGAVARYVGLLATTLGRFDEAQQHYEQALSTHTRMRAAPWLAFAQHDYARLLRRVGQHKRSRALMQESRSLARKIGMSGLLQQIASSES